MTASSERDGPSRGPVQRVAARLRRSSFMRFLVAGASTTLVSYLVYLLLLERLGHQIAYAVAFLVGVLWSYTVTTYLVFRSSWKWSKLLQFPLVYVAQYAVSALLLQVLVDWFNVPATVAPLFIVAMTVPLTFLLSRRIVLGAEQGNAAAVVPPDNENAP